MLICRRFEAKSLIFSGWNRHCSACLTSVRAALFRNVRSSNCFTRDRGRSTRRIPPRPASQLEGHKQPFLANLLNLIPDFCCFLEFQVFRVLEHAALELTDQFAQRFGISRDLNLAAAA